MYILVYTEPMLILKVVSALEKEKVSYAIVGGLAVALHGAVRGTIDIDIVIKLNRKDFVNAEKALKSIGLQPILPVTAEQVFDFRQEYIKNRNLIAWSFSNPQKPSEIVDIIIVHDLNKLSTKVTSLSGHKVRILHIDDLINMKSKSGRPQDIADIEALRKLK